MIAHGIGYIASVLLMASLTSTLYAASPDASPTPPATAERPTNVAPVEIDGDLLFRVRGTTSSPAEVRARAMRARIESAAADPAVSVDSLRIAKGDKAAEIMAGDRPLMTVYARSAETSSTCSTSTASRS